MTGLKRLLCGLATTALMAGCQQPTAYGPSNIGPSKFVLDLLGQSNETAPPQVTAPPAAPLETVVLAPEYTTTTVPAPIAYVDDTAPVYLDGTENFGTDFIAVEEVVPTAVYEPSPTIAYVDQNILPIEPVQSLSVEPIQTEAVFIAADPIAPPIAAPETPFVDEIVEQPVVATVSPAQFGIAQEPSQALQIEVDVPTSLEGIAPPPILEAELVPAPTIVEAPLDAPILPSTEILESELAPIVSEAAAPPRPVFTPIPQPGLSSYGSAF